jgi:cobalamin biosynthesis protein CbiG
MKFPFEVRFHGWKTPTKRVEKKFKVEGVNEFAALAAARKQVERSPKLRGALYPVYRVTCLEG